jgi:hypothetical protein
MQGKKVGDGGVTVMMMCRVSKRNFYLNLIEILKKRKKKK